MKECPKCHKKFDNNIKFCPVCGYKDDGINNNIVKKDNDNNEFKICPKCNKSYPYLIDHCAECGYTTQAYKNRMKKLQEDIEKPVIKKNIPKCPTCNSTNIRKISTTRKVAGVIGFGLLSKTAKSQFECKDCGYKW